jgi:hypothetical protein
VWPSVAWGVGWVEAELWTARMGFRRSPPEGSVHKVVVTCA